MIASLLPNQWKKPESEMINKILTRNSCTAEIEERLAARPCISVPTIVLQGADDGVDPPEYGKFARTYFTGQVECKIIPRTGHNLPQEAPEEFAAAILKLMDM